MNAADAETRLRSRLENTPITKLTASEGIRVMVDFYQTERAEDCDLEADGDMLLFQWGPSGSGDGALFVIDITRQFITAPGSEDDDISQLSLTFRFNPTPSLSNLRSGDEWCYSPNQISSFQTLIDNNPAYKAAALLEPSNVSLSFGSV